MNEEKEMKAPPKSGRFSIVLTVLAALLSVAMTAGAIFCMALLPGKRAAYQKQTNLNPAEKFCMAANNRISDALDGVASIKKVYWISDDAKSAPKPKKDCYGETDDPKTLQWLIDDAQELLEGQELYFNTDVELLEDTTVRYYLDDTILAIAWKEARHGGVFTFAETKIVHPSQFRRFLAGGEFGSGKLFLTTEMSRSVNAVLAGSGDYYAYRFQGITVTEGTVRKNNWGVPDTCYVTRDGDLMLVRANPFSSIEEAQKFMDDNNVNFSLSFGPILVKDGEKVVPNDYPLGEIKDRFTRAAICQMDKLHYLYVAVNGEVGHYQMPTIALFADYIAETGCKQGYTLDGGQTCTVVMDNELVNCVNYGAQRNISDIIYFATAMPEGG